MRVVIVCLTALALAVIGCGDDSSTEATPPGSRATTPQQEDSNSKGKAGFTTPSKAAKPPQPIPVSEEAKEEGAQVCRGLEPKAAIERFAASAKKAGFEDVAMTRKSLLIQVRQLRKAKAAGAGGAPVAAALYAISQPRTERSGAYQGCLQEMIRAQQPPG